jgi:hypothetical protein
LKREKKVMWIGLAWCAPFFLVAAPFILLAFACDYMAIAVDWIHGKMEKLSEWVGDKLTPPPWWPSHKYLAELNEIRAQRRKEYVDRMHSRLKSRCVNDRAPQG